MKRERDTQGIDLTGRIKSLEQFTGGLVPRPQVSDQEAIPINEAPVIRMPRPRRSSRVFLRHRGGQGAFAELTLTAPRPRAASD